MPAGRPRHCLTRAPRVDDVDSGAGAVEGPFSGRRTLPLRYAESHRRPCRVAAENPLARACRRRADERIRECDESGRPCLEWTEILIESDRSGVGQDRRKPVDERQGGTQDANPAAVPTLSAAPYASRTCQTPGGTIFQRFPGRESPQPREIGPLRYSAYRWHNPASREERTDSSWTAIARSRIAAASRGSHIASTAAPRNGTPSGAAR